MKYLVLFFLFSLGCSTISEKRPEFVESILLSHQISYSEEESLLIAWGEMNSMTWVCWRKPTGYLSFLFDSEMPVADFEAQVVAIIQELEGHDLIEDPRVVQIVDGLYIKNSWWIPPGGKGFAFFLRPDNNLEFEQVIEKFGLKVVEIF